MADLFEDLNAWGDGVEPETAPEGDYPLEFWEDIHDPWDTVYFAGERMPGIWQVQSGEAIREIDVKKSKDHDSATVRDLGGKPIKFTATGQLITREHWQELQRMLPKLNPRTNGGMKSPVSIYHPAIALLGVSTVYITKVTAPKLEKGIMEITLDMTEWSVPKPTKVKKAVAAEETKDERADRMKLLQLLEENDLAGRTAIGLNLYAPVDPKNPNGAWANTYTGAKESELPPSAVAKQAAAPQEVGSWNSSGFEP